MAGCIGVLVVLCLFFGSLRARLYPDSPRESWLDPSTSLNFDHPTTLARGALLKLGIVIALTHKRPAR